MQLENDKGSVSGGNRFRAHETNVLLKTGTVEYSVGRPKNKAPEPCTIPRKSARGRGKRALFWTDCPNCDLDNMLSCDTFDGDQLFQVIPLWGLWGLYRCFRCGISGFNTGTHLWRALELMRTVLSMKEAEQ